MHLIKRTIQYYFFEQQIVFLVNHGRLLVDIVLDILEVLGHRLVFLLLDHRLQLLILIHIDIIIAIVAHHQHHIVVGVVELGRRRGSRCQVRERFRGGWESSPAGGGSATQATPHTTAFLQMQARILNKVGEFLLFLSAGGSGGASLPVGTRSFGNAKRRQLFVAVDASFETVNVALPLVAVRGYDISTANFHLLDLLDRSELTHHLNAPLFDSSVMLLLE